MRILMMDEFSRMGGGQELFLDVYSALKEKHELSLITNVSFRNDIYFHNVNRTSYSYHEGLNVISLYFQVMRLKKEISTIMRNANYDLVFNNHPNIFLFKSDINYLHGFSFLDPVIDENGKITNNLIYLIIKSSGIYKIYNDANFFTHGKYTMELSKKMFPNLSIRPRSMDYANTPVSEFINVNISEKEDFVLTFGRINVYKNLEIVLKTAEKLREIKFVIAGAVYKGDESYVRMLKKNVPRNVKIVENPDEIEKKKLFMKAKVYFHTNKKEHYGVTVAEAISFGCVPVVPESGGPWIDIAEKGKFGFGYRGEPEEVIKVALGAGKEMIKTIYESRERFSFSTFKEKILNYFDKIANEKGI